MAVPTMTVDELKNKKLEMEKSIKTLIEDFIYNTNTVPKNVQVHIRSVHSVTKAIVLTDTITVTSDLEI